MAVPGSSDSITKQAMLDSFLENVRGNIQTTLSEGWYDGNRPTESAALGGQSFSSATPDKISTPNEVLGLGAATLDAPTANVAGVVTPASGIVTAATFAATFAQYTSIWTKIRIVKLIQYH